MHRIRASLAASSERERKRASVCLVVLCLSLSPLCCLPKKGGQSQLQPKRCLGIALCAWCVCCCVSVCLCIDRISNESPLSCERPISRQNHRHQKSDRVGEKGKKKKGKRKKKKAFGKMSHSVNTVPPPVQVALSLPCSVMLQNLEFLDFPLSVSEWRISTCGPCAEEAQNRNTSSLFLHLLPVCVADPPHNHQPITIHSSSHTHTHNGS